MKFKLTKTSDWTETEIEIETLQELIDFIKANKNKVVIMTRDDTIELEIYDGYRE